MPLKARRTLGRINRDRLPCEAGRIRLDGLAVTGEGDIDLRGFFGVDPSVRPGFTSIRGTVHLDSPASAEELRRLRDHVNAHCPVLDIISSPTPVTFELVTTDGVDVA